MVLTDPSVFLFAATLCIFLPHRNSKKISATPFIKALPLLSKPSFWV